MKVLRETGGQTCNKFWQYLYYLNEAILNNKKIFVLLADKTIEDYPNLNDNRWLKFPLFSKSISKILGLRVALKVNLWVVRIFFNNYLSIVYHYLSFKNIHFLSGKPTWNLENSFELIKPELRDIFKLKDDLAKPVEDLLNYHRCQGDLLVGVHIRWGDYKYYEDGSFYFSKEQYEKFMKKMHELIPERRIVYFIASNEPIENSSFTGFECISLKGATASQDLYGLSCCDYIIGTKSSYNMWASLLNNVPLYTILSESDYREMTLKDFGVVENYHRKSNGLVYTWTDNFFRPLRVKMYKYMNDEAKWLKNN